MKLSCKILYNICSLILDSKFPRYFENKGQAIKKMLLFILLFDAEFNFLFISTCVQTIKDL
jgi:hypothetical protein